MGLLHSSRWSRSIAAVALAAQLLGCATADSVRSAADLPIVHLSPTAILEQPADIEDVDYLSTGQPTEALLDEAAERGFAAVIDLRGADEDRGIDERSEVEARGMRYLAFPVATTSAATHERAEEFVDLVRGIDGPVLMHCASGNRVGSLLALAARAEGLDADAAFAVGEKAGLTRWRKAIAQKLAVDP